MNKLSEYSNFNADDILYYEINVKLTTENANVYDIRYMCKRVLLF